MFTMTMNILRNGTSKYATRLYPFEIRDNFKDARGELVLDVSKCIFCMTCARKCPSQCITIDPKAGLWSLEAYACVNCSICVDACPTNCLSMNAQHRAPGLERLHVSHQGEPPKKKAKAGGEQDTA